jgi:RNA polymerase sigma-70 factor
MNAQAVFEILVREHADMLTAFIRSTVRDVALVDDVFQETLLTAWRRLDDYDKTRPFGPWLRGIAGNLILAALRQRRKVVWLSDEQMLAHLDDRCEQLAKAPGDTLDEKLELLRNCVQSLPEQYREVIEVRMQEDEDSNESLATRLGLNLETLKKRLQRARARLVDCMQRKLTGPAREVLP